MKTIALLLCLLPLGACTAQYRMTSFYVKNTSERALFFKASVMKFNSMGQQFEMTLPFEVPPHDSVLARKVSLRKNAEPTVWFTRFIIFPADSLELNDPQVPANWVKSVDAKGKQQYTFNLSK